jgi:formylglycine-generating enzyme required for sulfatase activity
MKRVSLWGVAAVWLVACGREIDEEPILGPPDSSPAISGSGSEGGSGGAIPEASTSRCDDGACNGSSSAAKSCQGSGPGLTDCGSTRESCCTSLEVTGGTYYRTYDLDVLDAFSNPALPADGGATGLADPATVSSFRLDKYLVTVGRFRQFVNAVFPPDGGSGWLPAPGSGKHLHLNGGKGLNATAGGYEPGWAATDDVYIAPTDSSLACGRSATWTNPAAAQENLPINCVNWFEAFAFCIWDGGFLPSEAEWEYAAAGGSQQREFPWGSIDPGTTNQYAVYASGTNGASIASVGTATLGSGLWGQLDLAGELWEWNLDSWFDVAVEGGPGDVYVEPCVDCAVTTDVGTSQVIRGGSFESDALEIIPPRRNVDDAPSGFDVDGFRCARTP